MSKNQNASSLILFILIPIAVGTLSSLLSGNMTLYASFNKPPFSPPAFLFPIVWTVLYILMGISAYIICQKGGAETEKALKTYVLQLFFQFFWSILFFRFEMYFTAFLWLLLLIILIIMMIYYFYKISPAAAYLQIPYLLWCLFAAYLNLMIVLLN
ncbi:MAG: TspO/MBR family protein [Lachnospiraceae bacterium]|nr:TspO/MBR family protein [Lachnospiraceae bacterium]